MYKITYKILPEEETKVIYGDSVVGDTPIIVRNKDTGNVDIIQIEDLGDVWMPYEEFKMYDTNRLSKKQSIVNYEIWSDIGWCDIRRVIKHKCNKNIYRVVTLDGSEIDVTEDHSLLDSRKNKLKPDKSVGTTLLKVTTFPDNMSLKLNNNYKLRRQRDYIVYNYHKCNNSTVLGVKCLGEVEDYVYDIETDIGRYHAGIGRIVVSNTDSVFVRFETKTSADYRSKVNEWLECDEEKEEILSHEVKKLKDKCMEESFALGEKASKEVTEALFKQPILLEYEKTYNPLVLLGKKMYIGALHESSTVKWDYIDKKGVALKRRDNCHYLKDTYQHVVDLVMDKGKKSIKESYDYLENRIDKLLNNDVNFDDLIITKKLNSEYKNENVVTLILSKIMYMRDPGTAPKVNERVPFIYITPEENTEYGEWRLEYVKNQRIQDYIKKVSKEAKCKKRITNYEEAENINSQLEKKVKLEKGPLKQFEKVEDPEYARNNNLKIDTYYYINNQLRNPLTQFLTPIVGKEEIESLFDRKLDKKPKKQKIEIPETGDGLSSLKVSELKDIAKSLKIKVSGTKSDLIIRIRESRNDNGDTERFLEII